MSPRKIDEYNSRVLEILSIYLNLNADFINISMVKELSASCNISEEEAFGIIIAEVCGLDIENNREDLELYEKYFPHMFHKLNAEEYKDNLYYKNIKIKDIEIGTWKLKNEKYKPYEAFVLNDLKVMQDGRIIPQIGFFTDDFTYPAVLENGREWMLVTPNEVETMKDAVNAANGKVLTYGLGLGYFAYMAAAKENVSSVTVVERDKNVISLFNKYILPQFANKNKIRIINEDAYNYAENMAAQEKYDFIYTDIWHDVNDGIDLYLKMKSYEKFSPSSKYMYWIEKTLLEYID